RAVHTTAHPPGGPRRRYAATSHVRPPGGQACLSRDCALDSCYLASRVTLLRFPPQSKFQCDFGLAGTLTPALRALDKPIATACLFDLAGPLCLRLASISASTK